MELSAIPAAGLLGFVVAGVLTTVGAFAASWLVAGAVQGALTVARCLSGMRRRAGQAARALQEAPRAAGGGLRPRIDATADHALLARQAWWRLRC